MTLSFVTLDGTSAILFSDAVLSNAVGNERSGLTSAGERQTQTSEGIYVDENMLKMFRVGSGFGSFAGRVDAFLSIHQTLIDAIQLGCSIQDAIGLGLANNPISARDIDLIVGLPTEDDVNVRLYRGSSVGAVHNLHDGDSEAIGSAPSEVTSSLADFAQALSEDEVSMDSRLALLMGLFQCFAIRFNLIERGVGGTASGAIVDVAGGRWQPDILFLQQRGGDIVPHHSMFRQDIMVVGSSFAHTTTTSIDASKQFRDRYRNYYDYGRFDYVVAFDPEHLSVNVYEMRKRRASAGLEQRIDGQIMSVRTRDAPAIGWKSEIAGMAVTAELTPFVPSESEPNGELCVRYDELMNSMQPDSARWQFDDLLESDPNETRFDEEEHTD